MTLWILAFASPLAAGFGYVGVISLKNYDGRCLGLLDTQGRICTKAEFVFDYLFSGFTAGVALFVTIGWGLLLLVAALFFRKVTSRKK
jgi:hypothetical protein